MLNACLTTQEWKWQINRILICRSSKNRTCWCLTTFLTNSQITLQLMMAPDIYIYLFIFCCEMVWCLIVFAWMLEQMLNLGVRWIRHSVSRGRGEGGRGLRDTCDSHDSGLAIGVLQALFWESKASQRLLYLFICAVVKLRVRVNYWLTPG